MIWLGDQLNIKHWSDWYKIRNNDLIEYGASRLLNLYDCSMSKLLALLYPEYKWEPWRFDYSPKGKLFVFPANIFNQKIGFLKEEEQLIAYMKRLAEKLNIKEPIEWYNVSRQQVLKISEKVPWRDHNHLAEILNKCYDGFIFDPDMFKITKKSQFWLKKIVVDLFPSEGKTYTSFID